MAHYIAIIEDAGPDHAVGVWFPDLPGCTSAGDDIDANCRGVNFDSSRLKDCLSRNQDVVSAQCKADYVRSFDAIQKRIAARAAVPKLCERDIVKLCGGDRKEIGKALECLVAASGVSAKCNQAIGDAGYR